MNLVHVSLIRVGSRDAKSCVDAFWDSPTKDNARIRLVQNFTEEEAEAVVIAIFEAVEHGGAGHTVNT